MNNEEAMSLLMEQNKRIEQLENRFRKIATNLEELATDLKLLREDRIAGVVQHFDTGATVN